MDHQPGPLVCSSLVFFDLETTGIPAQHHPRITELSFCSVERSQFITCPIGQLPRVTNRLNLCIYPSRRVELEATQKTLLDNWNLEHQGRFDEDVFNLLDSFLRRLKKPVCLIAHNGNNFDFPILKAEINKLGRKLPDDLLCVDSLAIFKALQCTETNAQILTEQSTSSDLAVNPFQQINETTPKKAKLDEEAITPTQESSKKKLSFNETSRPRYNLEAIYERRYGKKPLTTHHAEADVQTLLLAAVAHPMPFLNAVDLGAVPFDVIKKCW